MTPPSLVRAHQVTVGYGGEPVIRGLDLTIEHGEFAVVVGPNGCGKSTLLKTLCRVNRPSGGRVELDGEDLHRMPGRAVARRARGFGHGRVPPVWEPGRDPAGWSDCGVKIVFTRPAIRPVPALRSM